MVPSTTIIFSVVAMLEPAELQVARERKKAVILGDLAACFAERVPKTVGCAEAAERIPNDTHGDSGAGAFDQRIAKTRSAGVGG